MIKRGYPRFALPHSDLFIITAIFTPEITLSLSQYLSDFFALICGAGCNFAPSRGDEFFVSCLHSLYCSPLAVIQSLAIMASPLL
jgi:hypothetical protein